MARDRKRAKQRRDRARRAPNATAERRSRRREEDETRGAGASDAVDGAPAVDDADEAPDTLDHASAGVDIANAQLALGRAQAGDDEPVGADERELTSQDVGLADDDIEESASAGSGRRGSAREALEPAPSRAPAPPGNKVTSFLRASWRELQRVQWPDRRQVAQATGVVVAFVIVAGAFLGLADVVFNKLVDLIL